MTSTPINSNNQADDSSQTDDWDSMFPIVTDPKEIQRRNLVRQQRAAMYSSSPLFQERAKRAAARGEDYWATFTIGGGY